MLPELNWLICGQLGEINLRSQQQIKVWIDRVTEIAKISCFLWAVLVLLTLLTSSNQQFLAEFLENFQLLHKIYRKVS